MRKGPADYALLSAQSLRQTRIQRDMLVWTKGHRPLLEVTVIHGESDPHLFHDLGLDGPTQRLEITQGLANRSWKGDKVEAINDEAGGGEDVDPPDEFILFVADDGDKGLPGQVVDRLQVCCTPMDIHLSVTMPPHLQGSRVSPLGHALCQELAQGLRIELGIRGGDPLGKEEEIGHDDLTIHIFNLPQATDLDRAKFDIEAELVKGKRGNIDAVNVREVQGTTSVMAGLYPLGSGLGKGENGVKNPFISAGKSFILKAIPNPVGPTRSPMTSSALTYLEVVTNRMLDNLVKAR